MTANTDHAVDCSFGDDKVTAFLQTIEPDPELIAFVLEHDRMDASIAGAFCRRGEIANRQTEIDHAVIDATGKRRTDLFSERAALASERESLPEQIREATRRQVRALLSGLGRIHQLASAEVRRMVDETEALDREWHAVGYGSPERAETRDKIQAKRSAIKTQIDQAAGAGLRAQEIARYRYPCVKRLDPTKEDTWGEAMRQAVELIEKRVVAAA